MQNLTAVWNEPENLDARGKVLLGAAHAGAAIERSMLGAAHAMANPLTSHKGVVHGQAVGLTLPAVLSYNQKDPKVGMVYAQLARETGLTDSGASDSLAFDILLKKVLYLRKQPIFPPVFLRLGLSLPQLKNYQKMRPINGLLVLIPDQSESLNCLGFINQLIPMPGKE